MSNRHRYKFVRQSKHLEMNINIMHWTRKMDTHQEYWKIMQIECIRGRAHKGHTRPPIFAGRRDIGDLRSSRPAVTSEDLDKKDPNQHAQHPNNGCQAWQPPVSHGAQAPRHSGLIRAIWGSWCRNRHIAKTNRGLVETHDGFDITFMEDLTPPGPEKK